MTDCVFCKIRDGQTPAMKVFEDQRTICIMDINPLTLGHCLVLSKAHAATIYDAEVADLQAAIVTAKRVPSPSRRRWIRRASTCSRPTAPPPSSRWRTSTCT